MNKELKDKWVVALRSGKYKQGGDCLRNSRENTYCCLGVLCDIHPKVKFRGDTAVYDDEDESCFKLPESLATHCNLTKYVDDLVKMNDYMSVSFKNIADWIEKNVQDDPVKPKSL